MLGPGGVGGAIAVRTGALCVATPRSAERIRRLGLRLEHRGAVSVARPVVVELLERRVGLLVIAVKAVDLAAALERITPAALDGGSLVLPLQNGLEHLDRIRAALPGAAVAAGSIGLFQAHVDEDGTVVQESPSARIAVASDVLPDDALRHALRPLDVPGIELAIGGTERGVLWAKAVRLGVLAPATIATGWPLGSLLDDPVWRARIREALEEACAVATADGAPVDVEQEWTTIESLPTSFTTSAARDAAAGRPTELDAITGAVLRRAAWTGVSAPVLESLFADAGAREPARRSGPGLSDALGGSSPAA